MSEDEPESVAAAGGALARTGEPTGGGPILPAGGGGGRGGNPTARRVGTGDGPPVGPVAILVGAGVVLLILIGVIILSQGEDARQESAPPCLMTDVASALDAIAEGEVSNIRVSAASNDLTQFALAVELDIEDGGCLSLPQGADTVDQRTAIVGAATIYNSQTEGRQINIEVDGVRVPPTPTPAPPTETPAPTVAPVAPTVDPALIPAGTPAPVPASPVA